MFYGFPAPTRESRRVTGLQSPDPSGRTLHRKELLQARHRMPGQCRPAAACLKADAGKHSRNRPSRRFPTRPVHACLWEGARNHVPLQSGKRFQHSAKISRQLSRSVKADSAQHSGYGFFTRRTFGCIRLSKQISFKGVIHDSSLAYRAKLSRERFLAFARNDNTFDPEPLDQLGTNSARDFSSPNNF